jgi:type II secretion system protein N
MEKALKSKIWRAVGYSVFSTFATLLFLYITFPWDAVRQVLETRLQSTLRATDGSVLDVSIGELHPSWFSGVVMKRVTISTHASGAEDAAVLLIPELSVRAELWPSLRSKPTADFSASVSGGQIGGRVEMGKAQQAVVLNMSHIDLAKAHDLLGVGGKLLGSDLGALDLAGVLTAQADLKLKGDLTTIDGTLTAGLEQAMLKGGKIGELDMPQVALGKFDLDMIAGSGKLDIRKFVIKGDDVDVTGDGCSLVLNRNFAFSSPHGKLKVHFGPDLLKRIPYLGLGLSQLHAPDRDGVYTIPLSGTLKSPRFM